jgi:hypothetical protein
VPFCGFSNPNHCCLRVEFKKIIPANYKYQAVSIDQTAYIQLLTRDGSILNDVEQFINCVIKFNHCSVLVTSFDFFAHNQSLTDDCAFGILPSNISLIPLAKVKSKNNMNKQFKEFSIFIGLYELLIVGGYILKNNIITPSLGSSLGNNYLEDTTTNEIHVVSSKCLPLKHQGF